MKLKMECSEKILGVEGGEQVVEPQSCDAKGVPLFVWVEALLEVQFVETEVMLVQAET